ncbi:MAG TPA: dihydrodipicolinate reductase C-terminal domain-containing protein [Pyrinomonadaceae bacterium]|nr:dihydrodipicolinate reductase C-terminal domain-containing protein [Pyrinomonadaceae bacterium]
MRIALIGYGAMGQLVGRLAVQRGDEVGLTLTSRDSDRSVEELTAILPGHDTAIDFSVGSAVLSHVAACARAQVPLVEGTTGWNQQVSEARCLVTEHSGALVYGANFSLGVNVFYRIVAQAASLFASISEYEPFIEEAHHARKRDAPSGTALRLRELTNGPLSRDVPIASTRAGYIPGTHRVGFDSAADQITLTHTARSREGFAAGALVAASWIVERKGVYEFSEVIDDIMTFLRKETKQ